MLLVNTKLRTSAIHGIGVFALEQIKRGQTVLVVDSWIDKQFCSKEVILALPRSAQLYLYPNIWKSKKTVGTYWVFGDNANYINHAKAPNLRVVDGELELEVRAVRDIDVNEELTLNYKEFDSIDFSPNNLWEQIRDNFIGQDELFKDADEFDKKFYLL